MLINLRNALMAGKRLPYDAEVEYLESTGMQYVDTGIYGDSNTVAELTFAMTDSARSVAGIFGARKAYCDDCFCILRVQASNGAFWMHYGDEGTSANYISTVIGNTTDWHVARLAKSWSIDNSSGTAGNYTFTTPTTLKLFAADMSASSRWYAKCRVSRLRIYSNGVLVRDFIPVRKGTVGYLYDRVSGKLFGNAGTGDFVLGPDVVPVEYIESHGTEYIDTKVIATNSHGFRVDVATAQKIGGSNTRIFGVHEGNVRCGFALYGTAESSGNDLFWGWNAATGFMADIPQRFVVSLNYKNDRAAIFNGTTNLSSLGTLGNITKSIYLLNANYNGAPFAGQYVIGRLYKAEISIGSDISNNFFPVRVGTDATSWEGAMMDTLTRRIYRNAGTGAFTYGNDLKYPIPAA